MILKFPEDIYNVKLTLYIWDELDFEKKTGECLNGSRWMSCFKSKHKCYIYLKNINHQILVHELVHFVFHIFDVCWIPTNVDSDEAFAYYMDYYYGMIIDRLKKETKQILAI
jgi:hypothetical protein